MTMPKMIYSVVIPAYNVAAYLKECVDSVLQQRSKFAYEVILIDDGSTDGTETICDAFAQDSRVRVIHQANAGVSVARNVGIQRSQGEYLLFVDGDDLMAENALSTLDPYIEVNCDTVMFPFSVLRNGTLSQGNITLPQSEGLSGQQYLQRALRSLNSIPMSVCGGGGKRQIVMEHKLLFDTNLRNNEDFDFCMQYLPHARAVYTVDTPLYIYRKRDGSASKSVNAQKLISLILCKAKHAKCYPKTVLADAWLISTTQVSMLQDEKEIAEIKRIVLQDKEIMKTTITAKSTFIKAAYALFGIYYGACIYVSVRNIANSLNVAKRIITQRISKLMQ